MIMMSVGCHAHKFGGLVMQENARVKDTDVTIPEKSSVHCLS